MEGCEQQNQHDSPSFQKWSCDWSLGKQIGTVVSSMGKPRGFVACIRYFPDITVG